MNSDDEQKARDQEWQEPVHMPGDVVRPTIDQEEFVEEVGKPELNDDEDRIAPLEWDHENN